MAIDHQKNHTKNNSTWKNVKNEVVISLLNARSLLNKKDKLELKLSEHMTDICCITESWTDSDNFDELEFSFNGQFKIFSCHRQGNNKGGGSLIMVRENFTCKPVFTKSISNHEIVGIDIFLPQPIRFFCVYRPPSGNKATFNEILSELENLTTEQTVI